ncbi:hypothetical protein Csa_019243 [Cucumis sativus]|uniref:Uncharacterized protein n=1 Tax=Cucumis sativus TaxID=3659 RepID=A0A0A0LFQ6_CUCSA|nr:hypothetical protein Csa_019243 [Cucumis sativus]
MRLCVYAVSKVENICVLSLSGQYLCPVTSITLFTPLHYFTPRYPQRATSIFNIPSHSFFSISASTSTSASRHRILPSFYC